jgi:hypothetical protein
MVLSIYFSVLSGRSLAVSGPMIGWQLAALVPKRSKILPFSQFGQLHSNCDRRPTTDH